MSLYVDWLNQIKLRCDHDWLTDAQKVVYDNLLGKWKASTFICLLGPAGSGKSFIGRLLVRTGDYTYVSSLRDATPGGQVVVDGEAYSRLMRPAAHMLGLTRVVVAMRQPPADAMPTAEIVLTYRDVDQFQHNLTKHGIIPSFRTPVSGTDLAAILRAEAIERGSLNGTR